MSLEGVKEVVGVGIVDVAVIGVVAEFNVAGVVGVEEREFPRNWEVGLTVGEGVEG